MAYEYSTGWEAGLLAYYTEALYAWSDPSFGGLQTTAARQHRTAGGVGGSYSMVPGWGTAIAPGAVSTNARWLNAWDYPNASGARSSWQFGQQWTCQVNVVFEGTGAIGIYRGSTLLFTSAAGLFNINTPRWVSVKVVARASALLGGQVIVKINGVELVNYTGNTRQHATLDDWDHFGFGGTIAPNPYGVNASNCSIDDVFVTDDTTGEVLETFLPVIRPNADATPLQLTPSLGGTHYDLVNEVPTSDANYNGTAVSGSEDSYENSNPASAPVYLFANTQVRMTKDGALTHGEVRVDSAGIVAYSAVANLPASPIGVGFGLIQDVDPATGVAWTLAGLNALKTGARITT